MNLASEPISYMADTVQVTQPHGELRDSSDDSSEEVFIPGLLDSLPMHENEIMAYPAYIPHATPVNSPWFNSIEAQRYPYLQPNMHGDFSKSFPVFDMRLVHRLSKVQFQKIKVLPGFSTDDLKASISKQFHAPLNTIYVIEEAGKKEGSLMKTIIIILPEKVLEKCFTLIIESYVTTGQTLPQMICARLPVSMKVSDVKKLLAETWKWKALALCSDKRVLDVDSYLKNCPLKDFDRIQAVNQSIQRVRFCHQPRSDMMSNYYMDVNTCKSVKQIKAGIEQNFGAELAKQKIKENDVLHFCFKSHFLDDTQCIGLILSENAHNEGIAIYFAPEDSIYITLQHKLGRQLKQQPMIIAKQTSTAELRFDVSKYLNVDPKAVKLTFEKKFIDEHNNLHQVYGEKWRNGIVLMAGIKKRKTIRIKHPTHGDEKAFDMYMLEPVSVLKRKVAEEWNLNNLEISLYLRGTMMTNWEPLQFYAIKNNMEIVLQLYPRRTVVKVVILKQKVKVTLIINDKSESTVEELLRFCAHKFRFSRQNSRGIYKDRCLNRNLTLEQEGIKSDDTIVIAYFDRPSKLQGSLINIFMVHPGGRTIKRFGTVNSGILLHAPKCTSVPELEDNFEVFHDEPVPTGIYVCDGPCSHSTLNSTTQCKKPPQESSHKLSLELSLKRKPEFLRRARSLTEPRTCGQRKLVMQISTPCFYLPGTDENTESELSEIETARKVPLSNSSEVDSECVNKNDFDGETSQVHDESDLHNTAANSESGTLYQSPDFSSLLGGDHVDKNNIKSDINDNESSNQSQEEIVEEIDNGRNVGFEKNKVSQGKTENYQVRNFINKTSNDSLSLDDRTDEGDSNTVNGSNPLGDGKNWQIELLQKNIRPRVHTSSEGSECNHRLVPSQYANMSLNRTVPSIRFYDGNSHLHTSGITTVILQKVGRHIGKKWRMLLRSLEMNEEDIDALEYQHGSVGLDELGCQAMFAWKQSKGSAASLENLMTALEIVGLKSVAEHCCTSGFYTA